MSIFNRYNGIGEIKNFDLDQHEIEDVEEEKKQVKPVILPFVILGVIFFGAIIFKLINLEIISGTQNLLSAQGNFIRKRVIPAPRGLITDIKGRSLVTNSAALDLVIYPGELPATKSERLKLYDELIANLQIDRSILQSIEEKKLRNLDPVILKENISQEEAIKTEVVIADYPGVAVNLRPSREYLSDYSLSHILGYISKISDKELESDTDKKYRLDSMIGRSGIESVYEETLRGEDGFSIVEVDSKGKVEQVRPGKDPKIGQNITLTLDLDLQMKVWEIVTNYINEKHNTKVVAIVAKAQTGEIEAMVSTPAYDNNDFIHTMTADQYQKLIDDKELPLLNRAISGAYPSGSSIKPIIAAAALNEGTITAQTKIDTPPSITIGQWVFPDNKAHGWADVKKAIAESNNVFFYALGGGYDKINRNV